MQIHDSLQANHACMSGTQRTTGQPQALDWHMHSDDMATGTCVTRVLLASRLADPVCSSLWTVTISLFKL